MRKLSGLFKKQPVAAAEIPPADVCGATTGCSDGDAGEETGWSSAGEFSEGDVTQSRRFSVVPTYTSTLTEDALSVEYRRGALVHDAREELGRLLRVHPQRIRLLSKRDGSIKVLEDDDDAFIANSFYVCAMRLSPHDAKLAKADVGIALTRDAAWALVEELLAEFSSPVFQARWDVLSPAQGGAAVADAQKLIAARARLELIAEKQVAIISKYGYEGSSRGVAAMLRSFDQWFGDSAITESIDAINARLELRPQMYDLRELPEAH